MDNKKSVFVFKSIVLAGIVQGVGFRPFVYQTARKYNVSGTVQNEGGSVLIKACGTPCDMELFMAALENEKPGPASIESKEISDVPEFAANVFRIIESSEGECSSNRFFSPDLPACHDCLSEINEASNRYRHAFNSCVACGPRFSILGSFPYDRVNTSMKEFEFCEQCKSEYSSTGNRRFHAETTCCNNCGPKLIFAARNDKYEREEALERIICELKSDKIAAIKGIGGFHLACTPFNETTAAELRRIKGRDNKPFALMFTDVEQISEYCELSDTEKKLLTSEAMPIVILKLKKQVFAESVLKGDNNCGCFLPYTPLHHIILKEKSPLVMTSANISNSPITIKNDDALELYYNRHNDIFSGVLYNDREILRCVEDSVTQVIDCTHIQALRRSRGFVPKPVKLQSPEKTQFLAMGGDLKSSFCLAKNGFAYQSQNFGDLENCGVFDNYCEAIEDFKALFNITPEFVVKDLHPGYYSSELAESFGLPVLNVQHHRAHIASVFAEHGIYEKCIGVAFDGTGYGDDGNIWGGEFFVCDKAEMRRVAHMGYAKLLGGDSSAEDAKKTAVCILLKCGINNASEFDGRADLIKAALDADVNCFKSSAMGRLFDAVSSILNISATNSYEGESAVLLQREAEKADPSKVRPLCFEIIEDNNEIVIDYGRIIETLYNERACNNRALALSFHNAVAEMIVNVCKRISLAEKIEKVALSGGVFQNRLLLNKALSGLRGIGLKTYINNCSSPNDGGISLGQAYIAGFCERG